VEGVVAVDAERESIAAKFDGQKEFKGRKQFILTDSTAEI
jgi:hypothetical protein